MGSSRTALSALGFAWFVSACTGGSGQGTPIGSVTPGPGSAGEGGLVCPTCREYGGGQTGDFGAIICASNPVELPLTDEIQRMYRLAEVRKAVAVSFKQPLQWGKFKPVDDPLELHTSAARFEPQHDTAIEASIALDAFKYFTGDCGGEGVAAPLTVTFSTKDGALAAQTHGTLGLRLSSLGPEGFTPDVSAMTTASLSDVHGSLDVPIDTSRIHEGELRFNFEVFPDGVRGSLHVLVRYYDDEKAYANAHSPTDTVFGVTELTIAEARFPADACDPESIPTDADAPQPWFGGESPAAAIARAEAPLRPSSFDALWLDGTPTRVTLDVGDPPSGNLCMTLNGNRPIFGFATKARVRSDDSRVDMALPKAQALMLNSSGEVQEINFGAGTPAPVLARDFATASGIDGVVAGAHRMLEGGIEINQDWDGAMSASQGYLEVHDPETSELVDCLVWPRPAGGKLDGSCRPVP